MQSNNDKGGIQQETTKKVMDTSLGETEDVAYSNLSNRKNSCLSSKCIFVLLACINCCILNYIYNIPTGLEDTIVRILDLDVTEYSLLYSVYSWPNLILPLIGGVLVHRITGIRIGLLLFVFIVLIGQLGFSLGVYFNTFTVVVMSRFLIGVGIEMSFVLINVFIAQWFKEKEITFVFALTFVATSFGGIFGIYLNTFLYDMFDFVSDYYLRLSNVLMVSTGTMFIAILVSILLILIDKHVENGGKRSKASASRRYFSSMLKELWQAEFWLVVVMFMTYEAVFYAFLATAQLFFISKYSLSEKVANAASSMIYGITTFGTVTGIIIDNTGYYISWSLFGGLGCFFGAHIFFILSNNFYFNPFIGNAIVGLSSCFITSLQSVPAVLFKDEYQVIAYSIVTVFQNIGYSVADVMTGELIDNYGYISQECFFIWLLLIGVISGIVIVFFISSRSNGCTKQSCNKRHD